MVCESDSDQVPQSSSLSPRRFSKIYSNPSASSAPMYQSVFVNETGSQTLRIASSFVSAQTIMALVIVSVPPLPLPQQSMLGSYVDFFFSKKSDGHFVFAVKNMCTVYNLKGSRRSDDEELFFL